MTKNNYHVIVLTTLVGSIIILNVHPGKYIMGFDNISPYFSTGAIHNLATHDGGAQFINYNSLLLPVPFLKALQILHIPPWAINQLYLFGSFAIGTFGAAYLTQFATRPLIPEKRKPSFILGGLFYSTSLFTIWIFNQPNFYFVASFASIPWVIYLLSKFLLSPKILRSNLKDNLLNIPLIIMILVLYLQTSLNLVAFTCYTFAILIIVSAILHLYKSKHILRRIILTTLIFVPCWIILLQAELLLSGNNISILTLLKSHFSDLANNQIIGEVTREFHDSSFYRNDIINTIRFAGNWFSFHDMDNDPIFQHTRFYDSNILIVLLGVIPLLFSIFPPAISSKWKAIKRQSPLLGILLTGIFLSSRYFLYIVQNSELLSTAFRWSPSKFWPLQIIPLIILATLGILLIFEKLKNSRSQAILAILLILINVIYVFPILSGNLVSQKLITDIPQEYLDVRTSETETGYALYLPAPQQLYIYTYDWGYYGSEFFSYTNNPNQSNIKFLDYFNHYSEFSDLEKTLEECDTDKISSKFQSSNISTVIWDRSLILPDDETNKRISLCLESQFKKETEGNYLVVYTLN